MILYNNTAKYQKQKVIRYNLFKLITRTRTIPMQSILNLQGNVVCINKYYNQTFIWNITVY